MERLSELGRVFKDKRVFVTGHTGFKGAWLIAVLHQFGAQVKGYALTPEYQNGLFEIINPLPGLTSVIADIRDRERLHHELISFGPDFIFHLAAQPLVRRSYDIPAETFDTNVVGTANLLQAAISLPGKCSMVVVTTDKVYENKEKGSLFNEDDPLGGYDPYSTSKACTELVVTSFRHSFFNPGRYAMHQKAIATARAGNVIGGGDWSTDRIIPDIIRALKQQQAVEVRSPTAVRPWQHVLEPVLGYLQLAGQLHSEPLRFSTAYNFGPYPDDHLMVGELVDIATQLWGSGSWKDISGKEKVHEAGLLKLDIRKALSELNWKPRLSAAQAIEWTVAWYRQEPQRQTSFTFEQIKAYLSL